MFCPSAASERPLCDFSTCDLTVYHGLTHLHVATLACCTFIAEPHVSVDPVAAVNPFHVAIAHADDWRHGLGAHVVVTAIAFALTFDHLFPCQFASSSLV